MARTPDNGQTPDASQRKLPPFGWTLFAVVWLLFPIGLVIQVLRTDISPVQALAFLASMAAFVGVFLWLMLRYPFPAAGTTLRDLRIRLFLLLALAALALYVELAYNAGVPWRFMYVVVAAAATLPTRHAAWVVASATGLAGAVYAVRSGWEALAANWENLIPFALVGVGMIAVSRLVVTIRELDEARKEIAQLAAAEAVAEERLRFARDLHDLLGHSLSLITLKSELAGRLLPDAPEKGATEVHDIEGVARRALREVREAAWGYRQPTLDGELDGARKTLEAAGISYRIENKAGAPPGGISSVLAWTVREGVTNVIRHSRATHCEIHLKQTGGEVLAEVTDDGRGSPPEHEGTSSNGSGLSGLAERVASFPGGDFEAGSAPEGGFRLRVSLPFRESMAAESASRAVREDEPR